MSIIKLFIDILPSTLQTYDKKPTVSRFEQSTLLQLITWAVDVFTHITRFQGEKSVEAKLIEAALKKRRI